MRLRPTTIIAPLLAAVAVLVVGLALGKSSVASTPSHQATVRSGQTTVKIKNFTFSPANLTVKAGTKITFHNYDSTAHTATSVKHGFNTGTINPGKSKTIVVKQTGTYAYDCLFHEFMKGTLKVVK